MAGAGVRRPAWPVPELVRQRSRGACERCGRAGPGSLHHRRKRSHGGAWSAENLVWLCGSGTTGCHGWVEAHPAQASREGFHLRPWEDALLRPVRLYWHGWGVLRSDGTVGFRHEKGAEGANTTA